MPAPNRVAEAQKVMRAGGTVDTLALAPTIGLVKFEKLDYASGPAQLAIGAGTFDLNYFVARYRPIFGPLLSNLRIPANSIQNPGLRKLLDDFHYPDIDASAELVAAWRDNAAEIEVEKVLISLANAGSLTLSSALTNVPRSLLEDSETHPRANRRRRRAQS